MFNHFYISLFTLDKESTYYIYNIDAKIRLHSSIETAETNSENYFSRTERISPHSQNPSTIVTIPIPALQHIKLSLQCFNTLGPE